jgi:hypothetical protein
MLALKILPRSTKSLLRQVLTGARQHQLPVVYAPDRDQMLGNTLYNRGLSAHYEHFEAMVVIKVRALLGVVLHHCQLSPYGGGAERCGRCGDSGRYRSQASKLP